MKHEGSLTGTPISKPERICHSIRQAVRSGELKPGDHLVEFSLWMKHKVSRPVIREALRELKGEGLLTLVYGGGANLRVLSTTELVDRAFLLGSLYARAAEHGTGHRDAAWRQYFINRVHSFTQLSDPRFLTAYRQVLVELFDAMFLEKGAASPWETAQRLNPYLCIGHLTPTPSGFNESKADTQLLSAVVNPGVNRKLVTESAHNFIKVVFGLPPSSYSSH